jgi:AcrR family transcriptional regulator
MQSIPPAAPRPNLPPPIPALPTPALPTAPRRGGRTVAPTRASRTLNRDAIVAAALAVLDADGLDAVTMRRVANELDTGPASLYAHVADKEEMVAAVLDRVAGEVTVPTTFEAADWQEQLKAIGRDTRAAFGRHRDIARATLGVVPVGPNALTIVNAILGLLRAGGVSDRVAALSVDILALYFGAVSYEESLEASDKHAGADGEIYHEQLRDFFGALPADRFPHLSAMAAALTTGDGDERFEFGLDLLVRGIASTVA